ncbi:hypothetical protein C8N24_0712 [Solirubrobacter pauli]|uniref:NurA domain-containing protein n=1 Tax=Solirubrobacter pauli TaxID=166793 RepID=A0A660L781_9ACTN|nr:hypothetical protein [Solirubrobacter pauli]RKQ90897.1 hypothetical protein C8N24_0712 [Solirubrobacter pauli]
MAVTTGLHFEDWAAAYGSPYLIDEEAAADDAVLVEPAAPFARTPVAEPATDLAFVDGVRRLEALVYHRDASGGLARGVVGAHACGAVIFRAGERPAFHRLRTRRLLIMGAGERRELASVPGYRWDAFAVGSTYPEAPVQEFQKRMRKGEATLAEALSAEGWLTIVDGPLYNVRTLDEPVVGYIKTHLQRRLSAELHARVPELASAQRTPLFLARESYSAYVRIAPPGPHASPWAGIVRIELPESRGLGEAQRLADIVTCTLGRFAGVAYKDPRAPQNLLPIGALEAQLRHRLGPADRAARAVRLSISTPVGP